MTTRQAIIREAQVLGYRISHTRGRGETWEAWARGSDGRLTVMAGAPDVEGAYEEIGKWLQERRTRCYQ